VTIESRRCVGHVRRRFEARCDSTIASSRRVRLHRFSDEVIIRSRINFPSTRRRRGACVHAKQSVSSRSDWQACDVPIWDTVEGGDMSRIAFDREKAMNRVGTIHAPQRTPPRSSRQRKVMSGCAVAVESIASRPSKTPCILPRSHPARGGTILRPRSSCARRAEPDGPRCRAVRAVQIGRELRPR